MPRIKLANAAELLAQGKLCAFATETVYGLGADATNDTAVAQIYAQKGRPQFNPLIVHFADIEDAKPHVEFNAWAQVLATKFWPAPLTLVLNRRADCRISKLCSAGGSTLAIRLPNHELARQLIQRAACPVAAPSANSSGKISPTSPDHVLSDFGDNFPVLDGGVCDVGLESTVVDLSSDAPRVLRPGAISVEMLEDALQCSVLIGSETTQGVHKSPGMLTSHYAPDKPVRIDVTKPEQDEFYVGFGTSDGHINLSQTADMVQAAANLFNALHIANQQNLPKIAFAPVPNEGIGIAINDRLNRAAAPR